MIEQQRLKKDNIITTAAAAATKIKNLSERLDSLAIDTSKLKFANQALDEHDDEYYIDMEIEPPRFAYYKQVRKNNPLVNWWEHDARETIDELNFYLKQQLKDTPEERYQYRKKSWLFHPSNMDGKHDSFNGCNNLRCIQGCRFYDYAYGRFEDDDVIAEHDHYIEHLKQKNELMEIELPDNWRELIRK